MPGDRFVKLFWEEPVMADLSHYSIYRNGELIGITPEREFIDEEVENGQRYTYEVSASYVGQSTGESGKTPSIATSPWEALEPGYQQTFEDGLNGWQLQGDETGFILGAASELGFGANSGHITAIRSEGLPAGSRAADYLTSPIIYSTRFKHLAVSFDYAYKQNPGSDMFFLMYRDFLTGTWQPLARLDSTAGRSDWKTFHIYLPAPASNSPTQIAFYYNDFYGDAFGAAVDNIRIYEVEEPAKPDFSASLTDLCQDEVITFTDLSTGTISSWEWDFGPDANPRYATSKGPHQVSYSAPGKKKVKLSLNHLDHKTENEFVSVRFHPEAAFTYSRLYMTITFNSQATNSPNLLWLFGDGTTSTETNPVHTYITKEIFEVKQIAYNGTCAPDTLTVSIDMRPGSGIDDPEQTPGLIVWPNPTSGTVNYSLAEYPNGPVTVRIHTVTGREMLYNTYPAAQSGQIDVTRFPEGLYILQVTSGDHTYLRRIAKTN
jgi:PKD repeat protein